MVKESRLSKVMVIFLGITLLGSSFTAFSNSAFAATPGSFMGAFVTAGSGGLDKPYNLLFGPDGNLYVSSYWTDEVLRYDGSTGAFIDAFVTAGSGGLNGPDGLSFGPDGNFYVSSYLNDKVKRYDGITGAFIDNFVTAGSGGLNGPYGLLFGPDGNLYVSSEMTDEILRYDGSTGAFIDDFVTDSSGGLDDPYDSVFGPDGNFYVASGWSDEILRYDGSTGAFIDVFVTAGSGGLNGPDGLSFGSDGNLYVPSEFTKEVLRYDGSTGAFIDAFVTAGSGGLNKPYQFLFGPGDNLFVVSGQTDEVLRYAGPFGVNSDPIAQNDGMITTSDSMITFNVLDDNGNGADLDPDGDTLDVISVDTSGGTVGLVTLNPDNSVSYDPNGQFDFMTDTDNDTDSFDYTISDGMGGTHTATVTVTIGGVDDTPTVSISSPADGASFVEGDLITLDGTATDPEDGGISNDIIWTSDIHGVIGTSASISSSASPVGVHTITATVTDTGGNSVSQSITLTVDLGGTPTLSITNPVAGSNFIESTLITFDGSATDPEDGGISNDIIWTSDIDGAMHVGDSFSMSTLSIGTHTITTTVTDSDGNSVSQSITLTVNVSGTPTLSITNPAGGSNFIESTLITFDGSATDPEDGGISNDIIWTSDIDGAMHVGDSFSTSILSMGTHTITATVTDSDGNSVSQSITLTVDLGGSPTLSIIEPVDSFLSIDGTSITFSGSAVDPEDGGLSNFISWASDMDGFLDVGGSFSMSALSIGTHTITATVTDSDFNTNTISITITIGAIVERASTLVCHYPPGNPDNFHEIMIAPSALLAHKAHDDKLGSCEDVDEKRLDLIKIKKHREETRDKNELKEKRSELKEIKKSLNDLKKDFNGIEKQNIKNLIDEIKKVIKKLNEDPKYDKEFKKILKDEIKETKLKIKQEMTTQEKAIKHKIDSKIHSLSKSDNPQKDAKKLGFDFKDGKTKIVIKLSDDNPEVVDYLSTLGTVDVKNSKHVQLTIKVSDLPKLNSINGIDKIRQPFSAVQFYEELSEGVYFINADLAQFAGITGEGIKAAVLDLAFTDNEKISDNIVEVKSFRQGMGYMPIQGNEGEASHGTAVAEIITDVAPDVELYLYSMETDIEFITAVDEAITQEVDIIAMSAGWPNFPTDGTSHITQKIEEAVENGIVFVVPSGNFADKHWEGDFTDANFNNWHDYSDIDEGLSITVTQERITQEKPIVSYLMWDVGMADVADFEMVLVDPLGQIVDYSANEQKTKSDTPFEYIHHIPDTEGTYSIGVLYAGDMDNISKRPKASLEIFSVNDELERPVSRSSVSVPADAEGAIVVGAVNHIDGTLEPFSSQGPTNNGRLAPHVLGPDGVTTLALGDKPFYGTSATTPYVAGLVALILQSNPDMSPEQVLNEIQQNADQSMFSLENEYDYSSGYGLANAFFLVEDLEVIG